ncbi:MAG: lamin tail domain-containing protein [Pirellulales bacterium]
MIRRLQLSFFATLLMLVVAAPSQAAIKITEAMSSSGSGGTDDWIELTNTGGSAVDITGYKMDDGSFNAANSVLLLGVTSIAAGQSVVFLETSDPGTDIPAFRAFWDGANALSGVTIGSYSGSGLSFSGSGDGVIIFDSLNANAIIDQVSFGAATSGVTFGFDPNTLTFGGLSVAGQFGAFNSFDTTPLNVGSPGAVPEPSTLVMAGMSLVGAALVALRRRLQK